MTSPKNCSLCIYSLWIVPILRNKSSAKKNQTSNLKPQTSHHNHLTSPRFPTCPVTSVIFWSILTYINIWKHFKTLALTRGIRYLQLRKLSLRRWIYLGDIAEGCSAKSRVELGIQQTCRCLGTFFLAEHRDCANGPSYTYQKPVQS